MAHLIYLRQTCEMHLLRLNRTISRRRTRQSAPEGYGTPHQIAKTLGTSYSTLVRAKADLEFEQMGKFIKLTEVDKIQQALNNFPYYRINKRADQK